MKRTVALVLAFVLLLQPVLNAAVIIDPTPTEVVIKKPAQKFQKLDKTLIEKQLGRKLKGKEKIAIWMYNKKLVKFKASGDDVKAKKWGKMGLILTGGGWLLAILGGALGLGTISILGGLAILVGGGFGIASLKQQKGGNPAGTISVILAGLYILFIILAVVVFAALLNGL
jgi:hypothetical protein